MCAYTVTEHRPLLWKWDIYDKKCRLSASLPFDAREDLTNYTIATPLGCQFELAKEVYKYMSKRKMKGSEFKSVLSSGEKKLLPRRVNYQGRAGSAHHATLIQGVVLCDC